MVNEGMGLEGDGVARSGGLKVVWVQTDRMDG